MKKTSTIFILLIIIAYAPMPVQTQPQKQALLVWDPPYPFSGLEYTNIKTTLTRIGTQYIYKQAWEINEMYRVGKLEHWIKGRIYDLLIVNWARDRYRDAVIQLIKTCAQNRIPILFLPPASTDLLVPFGLQTVPTEIKNQTLKVAQHDITTGVYVVAAQNYAVIAAFKPVVPQPGTTATWTPIIPAGPYALAVAGTIDGTPVAAIAPYLYADTAHDNAKLLENTIRWLLGMPIPQEAEWQASSIKNLTETIQQLQQQKTSLQQEIKQLQNLRDQLQNQTSQLKAQLQQLQNTTDQLVACQNQITQLRQQIQNLQQEIQQLQARAQQARQAYRIVGLAAAAGIVVGAALTHAYAKRKKKGGQNEPTTSPRTS